jgi:LacI family transcriptional regulator
VSLQERPVPTLASVAASAGVSIATVSKVVNGRADVGAATRARVQTLLEQHHYVGRRTGSGGRALAKQSTVELLFHGHLSGYCLEVLEGVLDAGTETGVAVAVSVRPRQRRSPGVKRSAAWVRELTNLGRCAVIDVVDDVRHGDLSALIRAALPLVVIDPLSLPRREVNSVGTTNFSGGLAATEHLLSLGHSRIAYLGAEAVAAAYNQARMHGYRAALGAAGVEIPEEYVRNGSTRYEDGVAAGGVLLDLRQPPTAVFAATDETAAGVVEAARVRGLRVPEDLSVVGFDDTTIARLLSPPLTTVRQPLREMGRVAMQSALRLAAGERLDSHHVELATELVVRNSTAPPKS